MGDGAPRFRGEWASGTRDDMWPHTRGPHYTTIPLGPPLSVPGQPVNCERLFAFFKRVVPDYVEQGPRPRHAGDTSFYLKGTRVSMTRCMLSSTVHSNTYSRMYIQGNPQETHAWVQRFALECRDPAWLEATALWNAAVADAAASAPSPSPLREDERAGSTGVVDVRGLLPGPEQPTRLPRPLPGLRGSPDRAGTAAVPKRRAESVGPRPKAAPPAKTEVAAGGREPGSRTRAESSSAPAASPSSGDHARASPRAPVPSAGVSKRGPELAPVGTARAESARGDPRRPPRDSRPRRTEKRRESRSRSPRARAPERRASPRRPPSPPRRRENSRAPEPRSSPPSSRAPPRETADTESENDESDEGDAKATGGSAGFQKFLRHQGLTVEELRGMDWAEVRDCLSQDVPLTVRLEVRRHCKGDVDVEGAEVRSTHNQRRNARKRARRRGDDGGHPHWADRVDQAPEAQAAYREHIAGREPRAPRVREGRRERAASARDHTPRAARRSAKNADQSAMSSCRETQPPPRARSFRDHSPRPTLCAAKKRAGSRNTAKAVMPAPKRNRGADELFAGAAGRDNLPGFLEGQPNMLLQHAVATSSEELYMRAVDSFIAWTEEKGLEVGSHDPDLMDQAAADWCAERAFGTRTAKAVSSSTGAHLLAGIIHLHPQLGVRLPRLRRAVKSWEKIRPSGEGEGFSEEAWVLLVDAIAGESAEAAAVVAVATDTYLRGDDWAKVRASDVESAAVGNERQVSIELGVAARGETSKTGSNQGVIVRRAWVGDIVLAAAARKSKRKSPKLFRISRSQFRKEWDSAIATLGLAEVVGPPHSMRHAGATMDVAAGAELGAVQIRGRWEASKSVARYTKTHVLTRCNAAIEARGLAARAAMLISSPEILVQKVTRQWTDTSAAAAGRPTSRKRGQRPLAGLKL